MKPTGPPKLTAPRKSVGASTSVKNVGLPKSAKPLGPSTKKPAPVIKPGPIKKPMAINKPIKSQAVKNPSPITKPGPIKKPIAINKPVKPQTVKNPSPIIKPGPINEPMANNKPNKSQAVNKPVVNKPLPTGPTAITTVPAKPVAFPNLCVIINKKNLV